MILWIDTVNPAPDLNYFWMQHFELAKDYIVYCEEHDRPVNFIDISNNIDADFLHDRDLFFDWLKKTNRNYTILFHSNAYEENIRS